MRIGGAFPFSVTDAPYGGGIVALQSGGIFYPPAGNYLLTSGSVTGLQSWDPVQQIWRDFSQPDIDTQIIAADGFNWRLLNMSGIVQGWQITNAGSGATNGIGTVATGVTITFGGPPSPGQTATAWPIVGGAVVAPTVAAAGTNFFMPPLVVIDPPPVGGIQATAIANLTAAGGGIASITMINPGAGYLAPPNFYLIPQVASYAGSSAGGVAAGVFPPLAQVNVASAVAGAPLSFTSGGAQLNAATLTGGGTLTGLGMINNGSFYTGTTIPGVSVVGCGSAAVTAVMNFVMTGVTNVVGGSGYGTGNAPIWETSLGFIIGTNSSNTFSARAARGVVTISGGAATAFAIEDQGFGLQKVPLIGVVNTAAAGTLATATAVVGGVNDVSFLQARASS